MLFLFLFKKLSLSIPFFEINGKLFSIQLASLSENWLLNGQCYSFCSPCTGSQSADTQQGFQNNARRERVCADSFVQIREASEDLGPGLHSSELPEWVLGPVRDNAEKGKTCAPDIAPFYS